MTRTPPYMTPESAGMGEMTRIPVSILTGFLGSGKTTLLNALLRHPGMGETAVVVNEFGEVGIDHLLVEKSSETTVLLENGCVCCALRGDLTNTLNDLFLRRVRGDVPEFQRLVIETTGLADPAPILHTLMRDPVIYERYTLDGVVTVVDAVNGLGTLRRHADAVKQVAVADRLVLAKCDIAPAHGPLLARLRELNPTAPVAEAVMGAIDPSTLFGVGVYDGAPREDAVAAWLNAEAVESAPHAHHHHHHDSGIQSFCVVREHPISGTAFNAMLEMLAAQRGEDLLRVKGILHVSEFPDTPAVIHGVQHAFHPVQWLERWPDGDRRTRIVFITRNIGRAAVERVLDALDAETTASTAEWSTSPD